mmetsp:Transcript_113269/g.320898  ORF Transcript_113269/g.320898 Transcript_113269/m.320898 type:complete len:238 (+) Transcript_113269:486-1199(+)
MPRLSVAAELGVGAVGIPGLLVVSILGPLPAAILGSGGAPLGPLTRGGVAAGSGLGTAGCPGVPGTPSVGILGLGGAGALRVLGHGGGGARAISTASIFSIVSVFSTVFVIVLGFGGVGALLVVSRGGGGAGGAGGFGVSCAGVPRVGVAGMLGGSIVLGRGAVPALQLLRVVGRRLRAPGVAAAVMLRVRVGDAAGAGAAGALRRQSFRSRVRYFLRREDLDIVAGHVVVNLLGYA